VQPNFGGRDPVIGLRDERGDRARFVNVPPTGGSMRLWRICDEWVMPTGGGNYLLAADPGDHHGAGVHAAELPVPDPIQTLICAFLVTSSDLQRRNLCQLSSQEAAAGGRL
jgi:hypothetical protein